MSTLNIGSDREKVSTRQVVSAPWAVTANSTAYTSAHAVTEACTVKSVRVVSYTPAFSSFETVVLPVKNYGLSGTTDDNVMIIQLLSLLPVMRIVGDTM